MVIIGNVDDKEVYCVLVMVCGSVEGGRGLLCVEWHHRNVQLGRWKGSIVCEFRRVCSK